jgi:hypothetical protein
MSIIQEALKKAQSDAKPGLQEIVKAPAAKKAPAADKRMLMAIILLALMAFAVFSAGKLLSKAGDRTDRTSAANSQEVGYRPIIKKQASAPSGALKTPESPRLVLNGIMYLEEGPRAIINNFIVGLGDSVSGAKIAKITHQNVILEYENVEITLSLK